MLSAVQQMGVLSVNESDSTFIADKVVAVPCEGMDRFSGEFGYTGGAPGSAPTIEFSMNGVDWDYSQSAPLGAFPAAGVTLYSWNIEIFSWRFVRLTLDTPAAAGSCRGSAKLLPKLQN